MYDLIIITRSDAGARVIKYGKTIMDEISTKSIRREFKVQAGIQSRLFE